MILVNTLLLLLALITCCLGFKSVVYPRYLSTKYSNKSKLQISIMTFPSSSGKILVTGIGQVDDDEFLLSLLNEQKTWESVIIATPEVAPVQKRFLSRTARYSGLLNILDFAEANIDDNQQLSNVLDGVDAWLALNVTKESIERYGDAALAANLKRVIFTTSLEPENINSTCLPEFDSMINKFKNTGSSFTGIRHGTIIEGSEDNSYEIVNATVACRSDTVERGVLARVASELLRIDSASNVEVGVSSAGDFAAAYLNVLRSSGFTRSDEVEKLLKGGMDRAEQMTMRNYEEKKRIQEERIAAREKRKMEEALELERERNATAIALANEANRAKGIIKEDLDDEESVISFDFEFDIDADEKAAKKRSQEILQSVWVELDTRLMTKATSKREFFEKNKDKALQLANAEIAKEKEEKQAKQLEDAATDVMVDKVAEVERNTFTKLLALERKEMENQKKISDTWVKYIYMVLELTMKRCTEEDTLFHNLDEFQQTLLLRSAANDLRRRCGLPHYEVVYDPLDAATIVPQMEESPFGVEIGLNNSVDDIINTMNSKYGSLLKNVAALRGAAQIIEVAIDTLKKELPPPPPSVNEMRRMESAAMAAAVSEKKLEATRNRGKPFTEGESQVGRM